MPAADPAREPGRSLPVSRAIDPGQLRLAVDAVWHLPLPWVLLLLLVALLACFDAGRSTAGEWTLNVSVGPVVLIALGLVWLPVVLRLLLLTGGTVKAGGVEASAAGIFDRQQFLELLTRAKAVTTSQGDAATRAVELAELEEVVSQLALDALDSRQSLDEAHLRRLAHEYERLRRDSVTGPQRTSAMTRIVNEVRVRAASSAERARQQAGPLLKSRSEGERIVGLALVQEAASPEHFAETLRLIRQSATAFEMFHALLAIQEMIPRLSDAQSIEAIRTLQHEQGDPRGVGVREDAGLPALLERTLTQLKSRGQLG